MGASVFAKGAAGWRFYIVVGLVIVVCLGVMFAFREQALVLQLAGLPMVGSLLAALLKVFEDLNAANREQAAQQMERTFALATSSHMSSVAFDRHVKFCEDYATELMATHETLLREGETEQALKHATNLHNLRLSHALWLTTEIEAPLKEIEQLLRNHGADVQRMKSAGRWMKPDGRVALVDKMMGQWCGLLGREFSVVPDAVPEGATIDDVLAGLRDVLGISRLTRLRLDAMQGR